MTGPAAPSGDGAERRRLRIALVHPFSWPDVRRGGERYLDDLAWYLVADGHEVHVITGTDGAGGSAIRDGAHVHRVRHVHSERAASRGVGIIETFGLVAARTLLAHRVRRRYDVVHALTPTAALAGRLSGHRTLYTILGQPDAEHFATHRAERRLTAAAIRTATEVAALSRAAAEVERSVFDRDPVVLSPGVRSERFGPDLSPRTGPPRVLFPADASDRRKHVDLALAAMEVVLDHHPDARLVLGGPGDHGWAIEAGAGDGCRVAAATDVLGVGALDDVPARYREATVTLLPSTAEAFGLGVLESLACGTPVVCLAGGGPEEIVDDQPVGRVVAAPDAAAIGRAVVEAIALARDPATPARCVAAARRWDWSSAIGPDHVALYRRIGTRTEAPEAPG